MYGQITANKRKTVLIFGLFFILAGGLSWLFGEVSGNPTMTAGIIIGALTYAVISYFAADKLALAVNGAKPITKKESPALYRIVENLAITEGLPTPKIYLIDDPAPNAFAAGRNPQHAVVGVTTGLLQVLDDTELEGVMAHELGHIKNLDVRVSLYAFALVAIIGLMADFLWRAHWFKDSDDDSRAGQILLLLSIVAAILAPLVALLIQLAISRSREYLADASGALTTRHPDALSSALAKIAKHGSALKRQNMSTAHLFFANPLKGKSLAALFSTHPPIEDRIKRLQTMGR